MALKGYLGELLAPPVNRGHSSYDIARGTFSTTAAQPGTSSPISPDHRSAQRATPVLISGLAKKRQVVPTPTSANSIASTMSIVLTCALRHASPHPASG